MKLGLVVLIVLAIRVELSSRRRRHSHNRHSHQKSHKTGGGGSVNVFGCTIFEADQKVHDLFATAAEKRGLGDFCLFMSVAKVSEHNMNKACAFLVSNVKKH